MNFIPMGFWGWWLVFEPRVETRGYKDFIPMGLWSGGILENTI